MVQQIQPVQVRNETANQLLVNIHTSSMTETQCDVYYYLIDTTQTTNYVSKSNTNETLPYKILSFNKSTFTGDDFNLIKQDENAALNIAANKLNVTLI